MKVKRRSCPVCGEVFGLATKVRSVRIWRSLVRNESFKIPVATCHRCGHDYDVSIERWRYWGSPALLLLSLVTLLLSLAGGILSLYMVAGGAQELNPTLSFYLAKGPLWYLLTKYSLTGVAIVIIVMIHDRYIWGAKVSDLLLFAQVLFAGVIVYNLYQFRAAGHPIGEPLGWILPLFGLTALAICGHLKEEGHWFRLRLTKKSY
jgi:hypothetical protein